MKYSDLITYKGSTYLTSIYEPQDNVLIVDIERCKIDEISEDIIIGDDVVLENCHSIDIDETLPVLRFKFDWYIAYSVRNESFTVMDEYEVYKGNAFRIYSRSRYIDFIELSTIASNDYPGPFKYYGIIALNHIVDIISTDAPTVTLINRKTS